MTALERTRRWVGGHIILALAIVVLIYMFLPIAFVVMMSFNAPKSRLSYEFSSFTWDNWAHPCASAGMCSSVVTSIQIGFLATVGATLLGTLVAFALVRHRFRGRASTSILIFLPMATPEVVMGSSLLNNLVKFLVDRTRPKVQIVLTHPAGASFPSGHAAGSLFMQPCRHAGQPGGQGCLRCQARGCSQR